MRISDLGEYKSKQTDLHDSKLPFVIEAKNVGRRIRSLNRDSEIDNSKAECKEQSDVNDSPKNHATGRTFRVLVFCN